MSAGYSKRTLVEKLGLKEGQTVAFFNPPDIFFEELGELPKIGFAADLSAPIDLIYFFTTQRSELERQFPTLKQALKPDGQLWVSWPKGSSKIETDLNENIIRDIGLENGLVDVKVVAVDNDWSGLKFIYRLKDRK